MCIRDSLVGSRSDLVLLARLGGEFQTDDVAARLAIHEVLKTIAYRFDTDIDELQAAVVGADRLVADALDIDCLLYTSRCV